MYLRHDIPSGNVKSDLSPSCTNSPFVILRDANSPRPRLPIPAYQGGGLPFPSKSYPSVGRTALSKLAFLSTTLLYVSIKSVREAMSEVYVHQDEQLTTKKAPYLHRQTANVGNGLLVLCAYVLH